MNILKCVLLLLFFFFQVQYDRPTNNSMSYDALMSQTSDKFSSMMSDFNYDNLSSINPSPPGQ